MTSNVVVYGIERSLCPAVSSAFRGSLGNWTAAWWPEVPNLRRAGAAAHRPLARHMSLSPKLSRRSPSQRCPLAWQPVVQVGSCLLESSPVEVSDFAKEESRESGWQGARHRRNERA
jgi:hypothetical protein